MTSLVTDTSGVSKKTQTTSKWGAGQSLHQYPSTQT